MKRHCPFAVGMMAVLFPTASLAAQAAPAPAPAPAPNAVSGTVNLALVNAAGNTSVTTINAAEYFKIKPTDSRFQFEEGFSVIYGKSGDSVTAQQYKASGRVDFTLVLFFHVFAGGTWEKNAYAGINNRFEELAGVAFRPIDIPTDLLSVELGTAVTQKQSTLAIPDANYTAGRVAASYKHTFSTASYFQEIAEVLPDLQNTTNTLVNSETSLVAPLSTGIALRMSYVVKFNNAPDPGFVKTDRLLSAGVQIAF